MATPSRNNNSSQQSTPGRARRMGSLMSDQNINPSSPLKYPTSPMADENTNPNLSQVTTPAASLQRPLRPSSLQVPGTLRSTVLSVRGSRNAGAFSEFTSPLAYPSSRGSRDPLSQSRRTDALMTNRSQLNSNLSTPREGRRNDIEGSLNFDRFLSQAPQGQSNVNSEAAATETREDPSAVRALVWATTVDPNESMTKFKDFLLNFTVAHRLALEAGADFDPEEVSENDKLPYYPRVFQQRMADQTYILNLDCVNLKAYPPAASLYEQLVRYPQEIVLHVMDYVTTTVFTEMFQDDPSLDLEQVSFKVRPYNVNETVNLRELNPEDIDKIVSIKGFVVRVSNPIPEMKRGFFRCTVCDYSTVVDVENGVITEPDKCPREECGLGSMQLIHGSCSFYNKQIIRLQETPDSVPDGQTPHTVTLLVYDEMLECVKPGDRVDVTGIYKAMPIRVNPRQRVTRSIFKTYVDVLHVMSAEKRIVNGRSFGDLGGEEKQIEHGLHERFDTFSAELQARIRKLADAPDVYELLSSSIAPSIFGNEDVKKAVLLQMFGGSNKSLAKVESAKYRGNIHVLLCGDPAMSKSQVLQYVHKLAPRSIYTSGKGSSAVGLTAYVTRDPETRQLVLESGALVLSDGGICCIDEFDKMSDSTRAILHEVMEQQTISVAKAGIITTLNARTSILAAANPIQSKWNPKLPVVQNVNLPPTLLSRFDVIFLMLDQTEERRDTMLARHLVNLYLSEEDQAKRQNKKAIVDIETFSAYIAYAREYIHPVMDDECIELIADRYVRMRQRGSNKTITATTRQLEALIRLSEAHAKVRLSRLVEKQDVEEAIRIIDEAMKMSAMDPVTGLLDLDLLNSGHSSHERQAAGHLKQALTQVLLKMLRDTNSSERRDCILQRDLHRMLSEQSSVRIAEAEMMLLLNEVVDEQPQLIIKGPMVYFERGSS